MIAVQNIFGASVFFLSCYALCCGLVFNHLFLVIFREELHSLVQSYLDFSLLGLTDVINTKVFNYQLFQVFFHTVFKNLNERVGLVKENSSPWSCSRDCLYRGFDVFYLFINRSWSYKWFERCWRCLLECASFLINPCFSASYSKPLVAGQIT